MSQPSVIRETNLHCQDGRSDKVYQVEIIETVPRGYLVNTAYGRRGSTLKCGTKTKERVSIQTAEKIADKLISQKVAKGYQIIADTHESNAIKSKSTTKTISDKEPSGVLPQLLNEIDEKTALQLCLNPEFACQEKHDGERRMVFNKGEPQGVNKKGFFVSLSGDLSDGFKYLNNCLLDGEDLGSEIQIFDALEVNGKNVSSLGFAERYRALNNAHIDNSMVKISKAAFTEEEKLDLFKEVQEQGGEGLVFKKIDAPYKSGRPSRGGDQFKFKFYATASVFVTQKNHKNSVKIAVLDGDLIIPVGNVTIPANRDIPDVDSVIEVRYMYYYGKGGSLFQPVFLTQRNDVDVSECDISQLKLKPVAQ